MSLERKLLTLESAEDTDDIIIMEKIRFLENISYLYEIYSYKFSFN